MFDVNKIRQDFPMIKNNPTMNGKRMVYFDNSNTTFKPQCVLDAINEYYSCYSCNIHHGDYPLSEKADEAYNNVREVCAKFIGVLKKEIVFTSERLMA